MIGSYVYTYAVSFMQSFDDVFICYLHIPAIFASHCMIQPSQCLVILFKLSCLTQYKYVLLNFCPLFESYSCKHIIC